MSYFLQTLQSFPSSQLSHMIFSKTKIHLYFLGAPEFESVLTLPRPPQRDRGVLFTTMIQHSGLILESLPLRDPESDIIDTHMSDEISCNEKLLHKDEIEMKMFYDSMQSTNRNLLSRENNIIRWGLRLSRLTAGYLPGDLAGIVRRAAGQIVRNYDDFHM